jgi:hypothetical protein
VLFGLTFAAAQGVYPVPWETARVGKVLLGYAVCGGLVAWLGSGLVGPWQGLGVKTAALLALPVVLWLTRFPTTQEIAALRRRWRPRPDERAAG